MVWGRDGCRISEATKRQQPRLGRRREKLASWIRATGSECTTKPTKKIKEREVALDTLD